MEKKEIRKTRMIKDSNRHFWNIQVYEHEGLNYILVNTFSLDQKNLADDLVKTIDKHSGNKSIVLKENPYNQGECYRVYTQHYN